MKIVSKGVVETNKVAVVFMAKIIPQENRATVIGLSGDLGAGKTTFMQAVAKICGTNGTVSSPTFVIQKNYDVNWNGFKKLIHVDAYRIEKSDELRQLKWQETISDSQNLIFIEWSEKVADVLGESIKTIYFKFIDENT